MTSQRKFLTRCIDYFGTDKQLVVAIEEMAELIQQLSKFIIEHPNRSRKNIIEEYTDVLLMLAQVKIIFDIQDSEIENVQNLKLNRLKCRMEKN